MKPIFADTFYFLAPLNRADEAHAAADRFAADHSAALVTRIWVFTELADGLAVTAGRSVIAQLLHDLEADANVEVVAGDFTLWRRGVDLYARRADKQWSFTDCISFVVMSDRGITDALTADHHFEQAGFNTLLK